MMDDLKELRDAVNRAKVLDASGQNKSIRILIDLAQRVLEAKGWPEFGSEDYYDENGQPTIDKTSHNYCGGYTDGGNAAIDACRLAAERERAELMERCSVTAIESIIEKVMFAHHSDITMMDDANIHEASITLRKLIEGSDLAEKEGWK